MSLVFVKRDNNKITLFSDGREMSGNGLFIDNEYTYKVHKINEHCIIGVCGTLLFKDRLIMEFKNNFDFTAFKKNDDFSKRMIISDFVTRQMLSFKEEKLNDEDFPNFVSIIVIDNNIYACERFSNGISTDLISEDTYAVGLGEKTARILLDCDFEPQYILYKMSKFYVGINDKLFSETIEFNKEE